MVVPMTDTDPTPDPVAAEPVTPPAKKAPAKKAPAKKAPARRQLRQDMREVAAEAAPPKGAGRPGNKAQLVEKLTAQLVSLSVAFGGIGIVTGNPAWSADGVSVSRNAHDIAEALADVAETNPAVRKALESTVTGSAWFGLIVALGTLAGEMAANHNVIGATPAATESGTVIPFAQPAQPARPATPSAPIFNPDAAPGEPSFVPAPGSMPNLG